MKDFQFSTKLKDRLILDKDYSPIILGNLAYELEVNKSINSTLIRISIERSDNQFYTTSCYIFNETYGFNEANFIYVERLIKSLLWIKGGYRIYIGGSQYISQRIKEAYTDNGLRDFDKNFMSKVYERDFDVIITNIENIPETYEISKPLGRHLNGSRIGFDAGGSDRKVSAVVNGTTIFSEEVVWYPKENSDPSYHYKGIMDSLNRAASKLDTIDAVGVSSAGIFINNRVAVASLFLKVPQDTFNEKVKNIYFDIQKKFNNIPLVVANDGDVTALAGAMSLDSDEVLGIAMGTSEAAGYIDNVGNITGWLNELAFVPVDYNQNSLLDEWSGDYGVGVKYFSQDAVIKLAGAANISFDNNLSPAEKLKFIQNLVQNKDESAIEIFKTIGVYLGYSIAYYSRFYEIKNILILGRVTSGLGGQIILEEANKIIKKTFPLLYNKIHLSLPDEKNRRVGQSVAAASLPII
ncbi:ROK family protein [Mycoplasmatota bacterium WC30]